MLFRLLLLFTLIPLIELILLLWLSRVTSLTFTIILIVLTGIAGAFLAKRQGLKAWRTIQQELASGRTPATSLLEGVMILVAAVTLITPGILTDILGFVLLIPPLRKLVMIWLGTWLKARTVIRFQTYRADRETPFQTPEYREAEIIDTEPGPPRNSEPDSSDQSPPPPGRAE